MLLNFLVFLGGAVLMSLEMLGSRLLAPTFGTSIYIWGSLITMVMAALTLGYWLGGRAADHYPSYAALGMILGAGGVLVGFLPLWAPPLLRTLGGMEPRLGSLLASLAFFFIPGTLLAMISPYGIKLASRSLAKIGHTAGRMAAVSSAGSILGTLVTSFFLIPALGVRGIIHTLGAILFAMAAAAFIAGRRPAVPAGEGEGGGGEARPLMLVLLVLVLLGIPAVALAWTVDRADNPAHPEGGAVMLYQHDSLYHHIIVDQVGEERHLHFDHSWQSAMNMRDPLEMVFGYASALHLAVAAKPTPARALFIGLGAGSAPRRFLHDYPSLTRVDVAEIDPAVAAAAREYFDFPPDGPRLRVHVMDGRLFVDKKAKEVAAGRVEPYDLIVIDAYFADSIPYHLTTVEFLRRVQTILSPDGVVAANIIASLGGPNAGLLRAMTRTYAAVFPQVYHFPLGAWFGPYDTVQRNIILIATATEERWSKAKWEAEVARLMDLGEIKEDLSYRVGTLVEEREMWDPKMLGDAILLTDDYAPIDTLQHPF